jgi:hypothetical protein
MSNRSFEGHIQHEADMWGIATAYLTIKYSGYYDPGVVTGRNDDLYPPEGELDWEAVSGDVIVSGVKVRIHPDALKFLYLPDSEHTDIVNAIYKAEGVPV